MAFKDHHNILVKKQFKQWKKHVSTTITERESFHKTIYYFIVRIYRMS